jgi:ribonuclease III
MPLLYSKKSKPLRFVPQIILQLFTQDEQVKRLQNILGYTPGQLILYEMAFCHSSIQEDKVNDNNERLEFLGDAILGAVISEYLYKKYPKQPEGFLTEMRSKIVNRQSLNTIAIKLGLKEFLKYNKQDNYLKSSQIFGNALEALIGAIYIDKGYLVTKKFICNQLISLYVDVDILEGEETNLKNKLIGWGGRNKKKVEFVLIQENYDGKKRTFSIGVEVDGKLVCQAEANNKKEASKRAAKAALVILEVEE